MAVVTLTVSPRERLQGVELLTLIHAVLSGVLVPYRHQLMKLHMTKVWQIKWQAKQTKSALKSWASGEVNKVQYVPQLEKKKEQLLWVKKYSAE